MVETSHDRTWRILTIANTGCDCSPRALREGFGRMSYVNARRSSCLYSDVSAQRTYVDHGLTGTNRERPGLREALAACRGGDTLVVTKLDRLARSLPDAREILEDLTRREVKHRTQDHATQPTRSVRAAICADCLARPSRLTGTAAFRLYAPQLQRRTSRELTSTRSPRQPAVPVAASDSHQPRSPRSAGQGSPPDLRGHWRPPAATLLHIARPRCGPATASVVSR